MIEELLVEELRDLLSAEGQLVKALPKITQAANAGRLKVAFDSLSCSSATHRLSVILLSALRLRGSFGDATPHRAYAARMANTVVQATVSHAVDQ